MCGTNQWLQLSLDCFIATLLKLNATITEKSPPHIMKGVLVYTEVKLDSRLLLNSFKCNSPFGLPPERK